MHLLGDTKRKKPRAEANKLFYPGLWHVSPWSFTFKHKLHGSIHYSNIQRQHRFIMRWTTWLGYTKKLKMQSLLTIFPIYMVCYYSYQDISYWKVKQQSVKSNENILLYILLLYNKPTFNVNDILFYNY